MKQEDRTMENTTIDKQKIKNAVRDILQAIGEDPMREGLLQTPDRVARMLEELTAGYNDDAKAHLSKTFVESGSEVVIEKDIDFSSTCEHHLMPFFGKVHIAYVPDGKVVGLSKLARVVDVYSKRLQLQERLNSQIADAIFDILQPKGVLVVIEAHHTCMSARGVKKISAKTITFAKRGAIDSTVERMLLEGLE